jgi:hypothetical protein
MFWILEPFLSSTVMQLRLRFWILVLVVIALWNTMNAQPTRESTMTRLTFFEDGIALSSEELRIISLLKRGACREGILSSKVVV